MFERKTRSTIDSLIGVTTTIEGDVYFQGGLRVDGQVKGSINAISGQTSILVISEQAKVIGKINAPHLIINGEVTGDVLSAELLELQPKARITGDVYYKALEVHVGALVLGKLSHNTQDDDVPMLKLANSVDDA